MTGSFYSRHRYLLSALGLLAFYLFATQVAHTLLYTIVAYLASAAEKRGAEFGNTVNEIAGQYHFFVYALAALLLTVTTWRADRALYRVDLFWNEPHKPLWQLDRNTKSEWWRGVSSGVVAAVVFLALFLVSGRGNYLGVYLTSTVGTPVFPLFFLDILSLGTLLYCEEYLFRHKILRSLEVEIPAVFAVACTAAAQLLVKSLQFDLSWIDLLNLALLNVTLGFFHLRYGKAHRGLAFMLSLTFLLHPIAGLPLWSNESPSFFLLKSRAQGDDLLFGGAAGPFAGFALSSILAVFAVRAYVSWRAEQRTLRRRASESLAVGRA